MLRSLLPRRLAAVANRPYLKTSSAASSPVCEKFLNHNYFCFSTQSAAPATTTRAFPSNLKIDPRSSFAPIDRSAVASIRVDEDDEEEMDEERKKPLEVQGEQVESDDEEEPDLVWEKPPTVPVIPLPDRLHSSIYNFGSVGEMEEVGTIWLNETIFGLDPIRVDLLKRAVDYHRAKKRGMRKAHTKTIGEIRGSGRKMRPQKGQGVARAGHRFAAHWRGGAKAHGPKKETNYGNIKMNKKVRKLAIKHVLSQKLKEGNLILVNQFHNLPSHKTKILAQWLDPFGIAGRHGTMALLLDSYWPQRTREMQEDTAEKSQATSYRGVPINMHVASGNLYKLKIGNQLRDLNVYDVLKHEKLVLTVDALNDLEARLADK